MILCCIPVLAQELTGPALLEKAIEYHDPHSNWTAFKGKLSITMTTPNAQERTSDIVIDLPKQYFSLSSSSDDNTLGYTLERGACTLSLNGSTTFSEEEAQTYRLTCERAITMKNYYTYLYGLPMKLRDPGTIIDTRVKRKSFKGKEYLVLKVNYEKEVGGDTWYFYFDPLTYAMEVYQFFHDESKNDGEYILLSGMENAGGILMPKTRAWYTNKDNVHLGTDLLTKMDIQ
ncbi:MAG: hypothetical protein E4H26_07755 [Flavobacteriales bacterium]|nr:MAG: hypothetical protein E4H26_07755 [Flavobacteriales bacterium]